MRTIPQPDTELRRLVDRCLDRTLDEVSRCRLEQRILADDAAMHYYLEMTANEVLMEVALKDRAAAGHFSNFHGLPRGLKVVRRAVFAAAAAIVLLGTVLWLHSVGNAKRPAPLAGQARTTAPAPAGVPARITGRTGARIGGDVDMALHTRPVSNSINLEAGLLELTFDQVLVLVLEGPAGIEITGPNSCLLGHGRAVAKVPPQAVGFTLAYQNGHLVDHGTEFAVNVALDGTARDIGVFRGEVEVFENGQTNGVNLFTDYAVQFTDAGLISSPFDRSAYTRELPTREFAWDMTSVPLDEIKEFGYDVTPLIHGPGDFRVVFRRLVGGDGITIRHVEIRCDGQAVAASDATVHTGDIHLPGRFSDCRLSIASSAWREGRWELVFRSHSLSAGMSPRLSTSQGLVTLEDGLAFDATAEDFLGRWEYSHNGDSYVREVRPDGTSILERDGMLVPKSVFDARWTVAEGVLTMTFANEKPPEKHILRDADTLVFLSNPYRNAHRIRSSEK